MDRDRDREHPLHHRSRPFDHSYLHHRDQTIHSENEVCKILHALYVGTYEYIHIHIHVRSMCVRHVKKCFLHTNLQIMMFYIYVACENHICARSTLVPFG